MFRHSLTLALALLLTAAVTACSTFSDSTNVARVDSVSLSADEFQRQLEDLGQSGDNVLAADGVRAEITRWIQQQLISDDEIAAIYDSGIESSGSICINAIVVADEPTADTVAEQLEGGAEFAELFAANNLDQQLAASEGALPCITAAQVAESPGVEFVQIAATLNAASKPDSAAILAPDGSEAAWVVVAFRPFAELSVEDRDVIAGRIDISQRANDADVYVDPRYGTFDSTRAEVVALG